MILVFWGLIEQEEEFVFFEFLFNDVNRHGRKGFYEIPSLDLDNDSRWTSRDLYGYSNSD